MTLCSRHTWLMAYQDGTKIDPLQQQTQKNLFPTVVSSSSQLTNLQRMFLLNQLVRTPHQGNTQDVGTGI